MYKIKEITLKNGPVEKKRPIIEFDNPNMAIIGEFLMADAPLLHAAVLNEIDKVLAGKERLITSVGNRCKLEIRPDITVIYDLFEGMEDMDPLLPCKMDTKQLSHLIEIWLKKLETYKPSSLDK